MTQFPTTPTTPEALRAAIAEAVQVDALQLQAAVGSIVIASSEEAQVSDPQIQSLYDGTSRTLTLLVDRIPAGQEELAFATALDQHLGHESAVDLVGEEGTALALQKQAHVDQTFPYMLLGRLQQDCEYYLGHGNRAKKHLWAGDEAEQIAKMRELYAGMREKPQWISLDDIARYEAEMCGVVEHAATKPENQLHSLNRLPEAMHGLEPVKRADESPSPGM